MKCLFKILILAGFLLSGCGLSGASMVRSPSVVSIEKGDTLYSLAKKYDVSLRDLIEINHLNPPYALRIGQVLALPVNHYHTVAKGDTLYAVSRKYNVDVKSLTIANNLQPPYAIAVGQRLAIPSTSKTTIEDAIAVSTDTKIQEPRSVVMQTPMQPTYIATATPIVAKRDSKFAWPVKGSIISGYGAIGKGIKNDGINIRAAAGAIVGAAEKGTVVYAGNELKGFGNLILIKHPDGWVTAYAHNDRLFVKKGQFVRRGEKIAAVGKTGSVTSPQLHFETHANKKPVNPTLYLQ